MKSVSWRPTVKAAKKEYIDGVISMLDYDKLEQKPPCRDEKTTIYYKNKEPVMKVVYHSFTGLYNAYVPK